MIRPALFIVLASLAAIALLSVWLARRMLRQDRREAARARALSAEDFRGSGYLPDKVLYCGPADRQVQLLVDSRHEVLRVEAPESGGRLDIDFRDLIGCQLLENGFIVELAGKAPGQSGISSDCTSSGPVENMQLVLYLSDALEPAVEIDLLPVPASRSAPDYLRAQLFARDALALVRHILARQCKAVRI